MSCQISLSGVAVEAHDRETEVRFPPAYEDDDKLYTGHTDMQKSVARTTHFNKTNLQCSFFVFDEFLNKVITKPTIYRAEEEPSCLAPTFHRSA